MQIDSLNEEQAKSLLRRALREGQVRLGEEPAPTAETRQLIIDSLLTLNNDSVVESEAPIDVAKLSIAVLVNDPAYRNYLNDDRRPPREAPRDFGLDPISFIGTTSLALLVLSTYINIKRDAKGQWTFQFKITASSDKLKIALIDLAKGLINALPKK